ncbi:MAG TPA: hypothetical protein PKD51_11440 [Saprospiraceae bacterium]|nr:hypothetical protein [Saprospiraceae bacterium]
MSRYYFVDSFCFIESVCYTKDSILQKLTDNNLTESEGTKAVMQKRSEYFWCSHFGDIGLVGDGCGKECVKYSPRNGKNGRCRFSSNIYNQGDKVKFTIENNKLKIT